MYCSARINDSGWCEYGDNPEEYENIELIAKGINNRFYDVMYAYNEDRTIGGIYLGFWNDGVV